MGVAGIAYRSRIVHGTYVQADERPTIGGRSGTTPGAARPRRRADCRGADLLTHQRDELQTAIALAEEIPLNPEQGGSQSSFAAGTLEENSESETPS